MAYTQFTEDMEILKKENDRPNALGNPKRSAADMKGLFDEAGIKIKDYLNNTLLPELDNTAGDLVTDEAAIAQNATDIVALKAKKRFVYADADIAYNTTTTTSILKAKLHPSGEVGDYVIGKNGGVAVIVSQLDATRWNITTQQMSVRPPYSASQIGYSSQSEIYPTSPADVEDALTELESVAEGLVADTSDIQGDVSDLQTAVSTLQGKPSFVYFKGIISDPNDTLPVYTKNLDWFYPNAIAFGVFVDQQGNIGEITDITGTTVSFHSLAKHITSLPERIPYQSMSSIYDTQPASLDDALGGIEDFSENLAADIAADYDSTATYDVGDYCRKDGVLYRCKTAISTAESWTAAHWESTTVGAELANGGGGGGGDVTAAAVASAIEDMTAQQAADALDNLGGEKKWSTIKNKALVTALAHVMWDNSNGATYYNAMVAELLEISGIAAVYTQGGTVYDNVTLDSLKEDLVVTATYADGTTETLASDLYTLSGTLTAGTSTITVTYGNQTTTFDVTVTSVVLYELKNYEFNLETIDTGVALLSADRDFSVAMDMTISSTPASGGGSATRPLTLVTEDASGMSLQIARSSGAYTMYATWQKTNTSASDVCAYGNGRIRFVVTHKAGSGSVYIKSRYASDNPVATTISAAFTATSKNVKFGNGNSANAQTLPTGTIAKAQILAYPMSEAEVNQWCGQ